MKIIDPGHKYSITSYPAENPSKFFISDQYIQFIKKIGDRFPGNEGFPTPGTNCQELLRVLIDRCMYLNSQIPCQETEGIIWHLRKALLLFEIRASREKGEALPTTLPNEIETIPPCKICGHIYPHTHQE